MSVLDLLRRRKQQREVSADEYVRDAVRAEAAGNSDGLDVGRLEAELAAVGMTLEDFGQAVEAERELLRLRGIVAGKADAGARFRDASAAWLAAREALDSTVARLQQDVDRAAAAKAAASRELAEVQEAEQQLRQLMSDEHRSQRQSLKQRRSDLAEKQRTLRLEADSLRRDLRMVGPVHEIPGPFPAKVEYPESAGVKYFNSHESRAEYVKSKTDSLTQRTAEIEAIDNQVADIDQQLAASEREVLTGA